MSNIVKLQQWVTKLSLDLTEEGKITRFDLMHAVEGEMPERCHSASGDASDIDALVGEIWQAAEQDAATRATGSSQRYVVCAFRARSQEPETTFPFLLSGRRGTAYTFGDSDPPNEKGAIGAVLRQSNEGHRLIMLMANSTAGALAQENDKLRGQRDKLEDRIMDLRRREEDLLDRKSERALEEARELQRAKRVDEFMGMCMSLFPLIAMKLMGKDAGKLAEASVLRDMSIGSMLKNLSEKEIMGVVQSLEGPNRLAFIEAYRSYRALQEAKDAEKPELLRDSPPPEEPPKH